MATFDRVMERAVLDPHLDHLAARLFHRLLHGDRAKALGIEAVAFDRSGYRYHGRVQALADAAREAGLKF